MKQHLEANIEFVNWNIKPTRWSESDLLFISSRTNSSYPLQHMGDPLSKWNLIYT